MIGHKNGTIKEYSLSGNSEPTELMWGHSSGEVWGLAVHPTLPNIVLTTGDDNKLCVWDMEAQEIISVTKINPKKGKKRKSGYGASSLSKFTPN